MGKYLLGVRTNNVDEQSIALFNYYKSCGIDVVFCLDETKGECNSYGFPIVSINQEKLKAMGLWLVIKDNKSVLWNCGDYFLYGMLEQYPNYDGYWLVEDDALIKQLNLKDFLDAPLLMGIDFSACYFRSIKNESWIWKTSISSILSIEEVMACSFGIVFISNKLCKAAYFKRRQVCELFVDSDRKDYYPNDEGFIMNFLDKDIYNYIDLRELYTRKDFENYKYSSHGLISYFDPMFLDNQTGFFHPILIKQNMSNYINRAIKIFNKQKKDISVIFNNLQDDVFSLENLKKHYFAIIFYGSRVNDGEVKKDVFGGITTFYLGSINSDIFWDTFEKLILTEQKFNSFYFIQKPKEILKVNYLKCFSEIASRNVALSIFLDQMEFSMDRRVSLFSREYASSFRQFFETGKLSKNCELCILNNSLIIDDLFVY